MGLRSIKRKCVIFGVLSIGFALLCVPVFLHVNSKPGPVYTQILSIFISAIPLVFFIRELSNLNISRLIVENNILLIKPIIFTNTIRGKCRTLSHEDVEIYISYFGILAGDEIIKFNQNRIRLFEVEIGDQAISFTYGKNDWEQKADLIHPIWDTPSVLAICAKVRDEMGIEPKIIKG